MDRHFWWVANLWEPRPGPAPPELAQSFCPVCGAKLSEAPVVECPGPNCRRWTHLESPGDPDSKEALNCYLAAAQCPDCHHPASLDPIMVPEPHEKLLSPDHDRPPFESPEGQVAVTE